MNKIEVQLTSDIQRETEPEPFIRPWCLRHARYFHDLFADVPQYLGARRGIKGIRETSTKKGRTNTRSKMVQVARPMVVVEEQPQVLAGGIKGLELLHSSITFAVLHLRVPISGRMTGGCLCMYLVSMVAVSYFSNSYSTKEAQPGSDIYSRRL